MSYLIRWVRQNQTLASRSASLLGSQQTSGVAGSTLIGNQAIKPLYQVSAAPICTSSSLLQKGPEQARATNGTKKGEVKDDIKYTIKFKELDVKKVFKDFYSLYGPLFVVCHIGVGLCSLGFFCSLVYFTVDLNALIPDFVMSMMSGMMSGATQAGSKFVMAYAIHKFLLPFRLGLAIWLTRRLSPSVNRLLGKLRGK